ncbi:GUN4 domain-containing protein [Kamptonema formosum]|uniref:GUN4 domain-containing protein n=1 Tax=Kamptonema formosum TaxID=331992 RepID=UPI0003475089|nr:GUN4 domain-containing protein [Oscillatoria sp. PCC 10802]
MIQTGSADWKTPLGCYERAIAELTRLREEILAEFQNLKDIQAAEEALKHLRAELQNSHTVTQALNEERQAAKERLAAVEQTAEEAQKAVRSLKAELEETRERFANIEQAQTANTSQVVEGFSQLKAQFSSMESRMESQWQHLHSQRLCEQEDFQRQILQSLSELRSQVSKLADELTLVSLASGADFTHLRDLLAAGEWKKADEETRALILSLSGKDREGWLDRRDILALPWQDLRIINRLWVEFSNGRFGFSVQKRIWQSLIASNSSHFEAEKGLGERVGWRAFHSWIDAGDFNFYPDTAALGHLPSAPSLMKPGDGKIEDRLRVFFSRRDLPS